MVSILWSCSKFLFTSLLSRIVLINKSHPNWFVSLFILSRNFQAFLMECQISHHWGFWYLPSCIIFDLLVCCDLCCPNVFWRGWCWIPGTPAKISRVRPGFPPGFSPDSPGVPRILLPWAWCCMGDGFWFPSIFVVIAGVWVFSLGFWFESVRFVLVPLAKIFYHS